MQPPQGPFARCAVSRPGEAGKGNDAEKDDTGKRGGSLQRQCSRQDREEGDRSDNERSAQTAFTEQRLDCLPVDLADRSAEHGGCCE